MEGASSVSLSIGACLVLLFSALSASCAKNPEIVKRSYVRSGDAYFATNRYKDAIIQYRNALKQDPRFGEARFKLAETYLRDNDPAGAYHEYIRAADLMPEDVDAQLKAAQMLLLARQFQDAKTRADGILANDPRNVQALIVRGNALAGLNDLDGAIGQLEDAVTIDPDRTGVYGSLGVLQLAKGDAQAAEDAFTRAVAIDRKSFGARVALALFYLSTERVTEAESTLKQALALESSNPTANRMLALVYLTSNRAAEAEPLLKTLAETSKTAEARLTLADYYVRTNRTGDALPILKTVAAGDSSAFAAAQIRLATIAYHSGQKAEAHKRLDEVLERQPKNSTALLLKASFLQAEHRLDEALVRATSAAQADPNAAGPQFLLGKLYTATSRLDEAAKAFNEALKRNPRVAAAHLELSRVQLASGNIEGSLQSARDALRAQPNNPEVRLQLARGLIAHRDLVQADSELAALIAKYPRVPGVLNQIGSLHLAKGDYVGARRTFERALSFDPRSFEALAGLVSVDLTARQSRAARARVDAALRKTPDDSRLLWLAATAYIASGDFARAEEALQRAITIEPTNLEAHAMLGHLFLSEQKLEQATSVFDALANRWTNSDEATASRTMSALILQAQNKLTDAQKAYEQIVAESPEAFVAANNLAWLYAERGNLDVALGFAQTAMGRAPNRPEVNDTLGWIYYKKDLLGHAIPAFERSIEQDPTNPVYCYHLGLAYLKSGERARGKALLEQALMLDPNFVGASDARMALRAN